MKDRIICVVWLAFMVGSLLFTDHELPARPHPEQASWWLIVGLAAVNLMAAWFGFAAGRERERGGGPTLVDAWRRWRIWRCARAAAVHKARADSITKSLTQTVLRHEDAFPFEWDIIRHRERSQAAAAELRLLDPNHPLFLDRIVVSASAVPRAAIDSLATSASAPAPAVEPPAAP